MKLCIESHDAQVWRHLEGRSDRNALMSFFKPFLRGGRAGCFPGSGFRHLSEETRSGTLMNKL